MYAVTGRTIDSDAAQCFLQQDVFVAADGVLGITRYGEASALAYLQMPLTVECSLLASTAVFERIAGALG